MDGQQIIKISVIILNPYPANEENMVSSLIMPADGRLDLTGRLMGYIKITQIPPLDSILSQHLHRFSIQFNIILPYSSLFIRIFFHSRCVKDDLVFYVYGSVHHNIFYEITNRCSYMQSILFHC